MELKTDFKLMKPFSIWFSVMSDQNPKDKENKYLDLLKKIDTFQTANEFWSIFKYIQRSDSLPEGTQFYVFQNQIKPAWEDSANKNGGRFIVRVRRQFGNLFWEELLLNFIADETNQTNSICGMIMHVKKNFILISIWIKNIEQDQDEYEKIQSWIIKTLGLNKTTIEYQRHPRDKDQSQK